MLLLLAGFNTFATPVTARVSDNVDPALCSEIPSHAVEAANAGSAEAQFLLGFSLIDGRCGKAPDVIAEAIDWLEKAAAADHPLAAAKLAILYDQGLLTPRDEAIAKRYYEVAAAQGHIPSQNRLGLLLVSSATNRDDQEQGFFWLGAAADQGDSLAAATIGLIYARGLHGIARDDCRALDWYAASELLGGDVPLEMLRSEIPSSAYSRC